MGLIVTYRDALDKNTNVYVKPRWGVDTEQRDKDGYWWNVIEVGSERDAMIAKKVAEEWPVDWNASVDEIEEQMSAFCTEEESKKLICEHLQW
jgi:hypothetical protein